MCGVKDKSRNYCEQKCSNVPYLVLINCSVYARSRVFAVEMYSKKSLCGGEDKLIQLADFKIVLYTKRRATILLCATSRGL